MAKSTLELAVDTGKWDAGLKKGVSSLNNFIEHAGGLQKALEADSAKMQQFVQMMGSFESKAKTAKGQMSDYKSAIEQLTMQYNKLTDAQKKTIGQDYLNSIEQLRAKFKDSKSQLDDINKSINGGGGLTGALDAVAGKFSLSIDQITKFGGVVGIATTAVKVAKDAFMSSEVNVDEWGRTIESAQSIYEGFLQSINTGDISGFLQNISSITKAARDAYDALDELETFNAFNQVNVEKTRTTMTESIVDFKEGNGSKEAVKAAGDAYKKELEERRKLEKEAYLAKIKEVAATRNVNGDDLVKALSGSYGSYQSLKETPLTGKRTVYYGGGMFGGGGSYQQAAPANEKEKLGQALSLLTDDELQALQALGAQAERTGNEIAQVDRQLNRVLNGRNGASGGNGSTSKSAKDLDPLQQVQKQIADLSKEALTADDARLDEITKQVAALQEQEKSYKQIQDRVRGIYDINAEIEKQFPQLDVSGQQSGPHRSFMDQARQDYAVQLSDKNMLVDETTLHSLMSTAIQNGIDSLDPDFTTIKEKMAEGMDIPDETWQGLQDTINAKLKELGIEPIKLDFKTGEVKAQAADMVKSWQAAGSAIQSVGQAMSAIEDPAAKVVGTVAQAVATMALSYAEASVNAAKNPAMAGWGWIAFAATGLATMLTSISAIKNASHFAQGGIVPGNDYSDNTPVLVSSGELILNRSQQNTLATELTRQDGQGGGVSGTPYVNGEQIFLGLNNYLRRTGRGELVTAH